MPAQSPERQRLRRLMEDRCDELGLTWTEVAAADGSSVKTLHSVRTEGHAIKPPTRRAIETGLQWARGSVQRILDGGDPVPLRGADADGSTPQARTRTAGLTVTAEPAAGRPAGLPGSVPEEKLRPYLQILATERENDFPPRDEQEARIWDTRVLDQDGGETERRSLVALLRYLADESVRSSQESTG